MRPRASLFCALFLLAFSAPAAAQKVSTAPLARPPAAAQTAAAPTAGPATASHEAAAPATEAPTAPRVTVVAQHYGGKQVTVTATGMAPSPRVRVMQGGMVVSFASGGHAPPTSFGASTISPTGDVKVTQSGNRIAIRTSPRPVPPPPPVPDTAKFRQLWSTDHDDRPPFLAGAVREAAAANDHPERWQAPRVSSGQFEGRSAFAVETRALRGISTRVYDDKGKLLGTSTEPWNWEPRPAETPTATFDGRARQLSGDESAALVLRYQGLGTGTYLPSLGQIPARLRDALPEGARVSMVVPLEGVGTTTSVIVVETESRVALYTNTGSLLAARDAARTWSAAK